MKCPYCSGEMEAGYIEKARGPLAWTPEGHRVPLLFPLLEGKSIIIAEDNKGPAFGSMVNAALCRNCFKIIIDLEHLCDRSSEP